MERLGQIRREIPNIKYAYIMRRTEDPYTLKFVVDADSFVPEEEWDENGNGIIDPEEEPSYPGDPYDVSEVAAMQNEAFVQATVDEEVTYDQWGALISGYAPIRNSAGETVAILGLDMTAEDYVKIAKSAFSSILFLLFAVMTVLFGVSVVILTWKHRINTLREVDRERGALVGLALHQLGTPLAIFRWWMEIVKEKYGDLICKETDACKQLEEGIAQLQHVYNDLQQAHTVRNRRLSYSMERASLGSIITREAEVFSKKLEQKKQVVELEIPKDVIMQLDSKLIGAVVNELLENASAFSPPETTITISAQRRKHDAVVSVQDHGCGISEEDLPHLFKEFARGSEAYKFKPMGNGIGLFIAKNILEEAGGKIWVESKKGEGTTVSFSLPLSRKK
ncbi:hypothetical protein COU79_04390 [Candidatus Peregrinibacteria bacterium CG10_big_fil_rev_8_21_14_0_10_54_7]|nr:MAG: hypothetical protein COU79_04390 [Candidatus Peregrinibacteria bacterium CG10_big_fil_rev_8_21_14_0_10_54_7]